MEEDIFKTKEFLDFANSMQKNIRRKGWKAKFTHAWKLVDVFRYLRKQKFYGMVKMPCSEQLYTYVVDSVNRKLVQKILEGEIVKFPYGLGTLGIYAVKESNTPIKKSKYKKTNLRAIDWWKTFKLWYTDEEAKQKKIVVTMNRRLYYIKYNPPRFGFFNKQYYEFKPARSLETLIKQSVREGKTYPIYEEVGRFKY